MTEVYDNFYTNVKWQQSSGPIISRKVHMDDGAESPTALVWPEGGNFDTLKDGDHPILAIGRKANRPHNITAVVMTYDSATDAAQFNMADKFISRQFVVNIESYGPVAQKNTIYAGDPVFVDDSADVSTAGAGATLSFSPVNVSTKDNPLAGYVFWCQDEYDDSGVGGVSSSQGINQPAATDTTEVLTLCIIQVNDCGVFDSGSGN